MKEDLRDLTQVRELGQVETLAELIADRIGQLVSYSSLSRDIGASVDSIRRCIRTLEFLYYCFSVRPWYKNVTRSLRKEPKYFLWDWSQVKDPSARAENMVASALLKAVHAWSDRGQGDFALHFIRDKERREVDFVVVRDRHPWFLVEVKSSGRASISAHLRRFQEESAPRFSLDRGAPTAITDSRRSPSLRMRSLSVLGLRPSLSAAPQAPPICQLVTTPEVGWDMVVNQNIFVEGVLPNAIVRDLTEEEMNRRRRSG